MARDIAVAALVAFSAGVMSGVIVTTALAIRSKGRRNSIAASRSDLPRVQGPAFDGDPCPRLQRPHRRLICPVGVSGSQVFWLFLRS